MEKFFIMGHDTANITPEQVLTMLRPVGMACETDMLEATGGVNTHRRDLRFWPAQRGGGKAGGQRGAG
jgi:triphosphoribosyl-dephospho-CoA synthetase